jgi:predicted pyridoxine 5'-phosphate oxidase superfamily flavin-nucleotide-binding protein
MAHDKDPWFSYHEGELAVQRRAGVGRGPGAMYRPAMPAGVREFIAEQQLAILASIGRDGRLWASLRSGAPGSVTAIDEQTLRIGGYGHPEDPLADNLTAHDQLGLLIIDLATRSRLRVNGTAILKPDGAILLKTKQIYGNCQKYIQARAIVGTREPLAPVVRRSEQLDAPQQSRIAGADTFFIATAHAEVGADASHRGGLPGFVRIESVNRLIFPDYRGNRMFNTLGNLESNPRAGLLFPDFATGDALQLSGRAAVLWDDPRLAEFPGAQRLVAFDIEKIIQLAEATHLRFRFAGYSPDLPR